MAWSCTGISADPICVLTTYSNFLRTFLPSSELSSENAQSAHHLCELSIIVTSISLITPSCSTASHLRMLQGERRKPYVCSPPKVCISPVDSGPLPWRKFYLSTLTSTEDNRNESTLELILLPKHFTNSLHFLRLVSRYQISHQHSLLSAFSSLVAPQAQHLVAHTLR